MAEEHVGVYAGTFDPITNGHMDIISRAARHLVDRLILAVARNPGKGPLFSLDDRVAMVREELDASDFGDRVQVVPFDTLLTDFAEANGANVLIRGLRAVSDFEYEFQMASMNRYLKPQIETTFLMASDRNQFISSRLVKEICMLNGDISKFVSPRVAAKLIAKR
jgi:pantetheine-phosphate adenylyltransferase